MPFGTGTYNSIYKDAKPRPQVHELHMMITQLAGYHWTALTSNAHQDTIDELCRAGEGLKKALLSLMIDVCIEEMRELLPVHIEINEALWVEYNNKLQQRRKDNGIETREGDPALRSLRALENRMPSMEGWPKLDCISAPDANERQYSMGEMKIYRLRCGPLRCGIQKEDGMCPHGYITVLGEKPPCWTDGVGWVEEKNPFQIANHGRWKSPRYTFENGRLSLPWRTEPMYNSFQV